MTRNRKGCAGWHQFATPKSLKSTCNSTGAASCIKAFIVTLALRGILPMGFATWLIRQLHLGGA